MTPPHVCSSHEAWFRHGPRKGSTVIHPVLETQENKLQVGPTKTNVALINERMANRNEQSLLVNGFAIRFACLAFKPVDGGLSRLPEWTVRWLDLWRPHFALSFVRISGCHGHPMTGAPSRHPAIPLSPAISAVSAGPDIGKPANQANRPPPPNEMPTCCSLHLSSIPRQLNMCVAFDSNSTRFMVLTSSPRLRS